MRLITVFKVNKSYSLSSLSIKSDVVLSCRCTFLGHIIDVRLAIREYSLGKDKQNSTTGKRATIPRRTRETTKKFLDIVNQCMSRMEAIKLDEIAE